MQAQRMPARQGLVWIIAGFRLLRANPPLLTILSFGYLMSVSIALALPLNIGRIIFVLVQPMLVLIIANGCRAIAQYGRRITKLNVVAGVREHRGELMRLGALQMAALLICTATVVLVLGGLLDVKPDPARPQDAMPLLIASVVVSLPVMMATWFAPLLIGWHGLAPVKAAFFSLVAILRNWRAFLVYALLIGTGFGIALLTVLATQQIEGSVGQVIGMLVEFLLLLTAPIVISGPYLSYRDIFVVPTAAND